MPLPSTLPAVTSMKAIQNTLLHHKKAYAQL